MKNKKTLFGVLFVCLIGVVGTTIAFYNSSDIFENIFGTKAYKMSVTEIFESPDGWTPGTTTPKTISATNTGDVGAAVRISFQQEWKDADGNTLSLRDSRYNQVSIIDFTNKYDNMWQVSTEDGVDYYYYKVKLDKNETTTNLIDSVTFNPNTIITTTHDCSTDSDTNTKTCTSDTSGYAGGTYKLIATVETVQYDQYKEIWGTNTKIVDKITKVGNYDVFGSAEDIEKYETQVCIKDECFIVLGKDNDNHINMLAKNNLKVGGHYDTTWGIHPTFIWSSDEPGYGLQSLEAVGYTGSLEFSTNNYWVGNDSYGATDPKWVYDDNASIKQYVDDYADILNGYGATATGRLLNMEELELIFNDGNPFETLPSSSMDSIIIDNAPSWALDGKYYWTGVANGDYVLAIFSGRLFSMTATSPWPIGSRPVIVIDNPLI